MLVIDRGRRRLVFVAAAVVFFIILAGYFRPSKADIRSHIDKIHLPASLKSSGSKPTTPTDPSFADDSSKSNSGDQSETSFGDQDIAIEETQDADDSHPIAALMKDADQRWKKYENTRSLTFKETVSKYRRQYGRHPPPGFEKWYLYAREKNVFNIDDFEQIMDDLRPFWALEPKVIRTLAAHMWEKPDEAVSGIHIRDHKIVKQSLQSWRSETMVTLIEKFIDRLPDMDIAMNRADQPRVVVPWADMQSLLAKELETRQMPPEANNEFSKTQPNLLDITLEPENDASPREDPGWFGAHGKQYMEIAKTACPPESHAVKKGSSKKDAEKLYKSDIGGIVTNYNRSSDLCTVGPEIMDKHGFLFSASTIIATTRLVPIFGECKVNINSDILFPANMYWKHDDRYDYNGQGDLDWVDKKDSMIWRGVTSGGVQLADNWQRMHRQRLVMLLNNTLLRDNQNITVLSERPGSNGEYERFEHFQAAEFAEDHTDVGFVEAWGCIPNCSFYDEYLLMKPQVTMPEQFQSKFLVDVDGHSFSGRWRAFLESKSLGIKATIFREWHDSRLFAWRHFVPMDNRFDDVYSLLSYFIGYGQPGNNRKSTDAYVARHDVEGKRIAQQGREWANKVLRRDDIEVCRRMLSLANPLSFMLTP